MGWAATHIEGIWTWACVQAAGSHRDKKRNTEIYIQFLQAPIPGCPSGEENLE